MTYNKMETPIHDFLDRYAASNTVRCHMPGSKGLYDAFDITEISGADVLYESSGIILQSEKNAARLFGAAYTCYSCGGSTLCIQAMLAAAKSVTGKNRIAAGRFSHKSLVNTAVLLGMEIDWIYPDSFLSSAAPVDSLETAINSDTAAVFVTTVDYYGGGADIRRVSEICRKKGVLLLADNAHGAYKVFTGDHPIALGADMCADSAHKTLPAPTGAACLHTTGERLYHEAKAAMSLFGSSSPSYLMLDALDKLNKYIYEQKDAALESIERVRGLKKKLADMGYFLRKSDDMRIVIDAAQVGFTGFELGELLRRGGIECEMSDERYVVLLFSTVQPEKDFSRIPDVFGGITAKKPLDIREMPVIKPEKATPPREAYFSPRETIPTKSSVGRICGGVECPCPPCVPIVMPGEIISAQAAELLLRYGVGTISAVVQNI